MFFLSGTRFSGLLPEGVGLIREIPSIPIPSISLSMDITTMPSSSTIFQNLRSRFPSNFMLIQQMVDGRPPIVNIAMPQPVLLETNLSPVDNKILDGTSTDDDIKNFQNKNLLEREEFFNNPRVQSVFLNRIITGKYIHSNINIIEGLKNCSANANTYRQLLWPQGILQNKPELAFIIKFFTNLTVENKEDIAVAAFQSNIFNQNLIIKEISKNHNFFITSKSDVAIQKIAKAITFLINNNSMDFSETSILDMCRTMERNATSNAAKLSLQEMCLAIKIATNQDLSLRNLTNCRPIHINSENFTVLSIR